MRDSEESLAVVLAEDNRTSVEGASISYNERELNGGQHYPLEKLPLYGSPAIALFCIQHRVRVKCIDPEIDVPLVASFAWCICSTPALRSTSLRFFSILAINDLKSLSSDLQADLPRVPN